MPSAAIPSAQIWTGTDHLDLPLQVQNPSTFKRFVEVGRVVLVNDGPSQGKLAVIAEIIDHNRVRRLGPPKDRAEADLFRYLLLLCSRYGSTRPVTARPLQQALIDGPSTSVPRQPLPYRSLILTPYTIASLPRAAGTGAIRKAFEKAEVQAKWEGSSWSKKLVARETRRQASDFERFEVSLLKRQRRDQVRGGTRVCAGSLLTN